jgi:hypothetical protein
MLILAVLVGFVIWMFSGSSSPKEITVVIREKKEGDSTTTTVDAFVKGSSASANAVVGRDSVVAKMTYRKGDSDAIEIDSLLPKEKLDQIIVATGKAIEMGKLS